MKVAVRRQHKEFTIGVAFDWLYPKALVFYVGPVYVSIEQG